MKTPVILAAAGRPDQIEVVHTIDTFGCARFHPFGNGKPQKRAGPSKFQLLKRAAGTGAAEEATGAGL
jgi:hypothetical protein